MSEENGRAVTFYQLARASREKYTYFLMAAAGAALALIVEKAGPPTTLAELQNLATTAVLWALSFISGCIAVICDQKTWSAEFRAQKISDATARLEKKELREANHKKFDLATADVSRFARVGDHLRLYQLLTLTGGALVYFTYRVLQWFPTGDFPKG